MSSLLKPCQAKNKGLLCENDARAKCFHCSHDLCLFHLTEHSQMLESQTRSSFDIYDEILNNLQSKIETLTIPTRIMESPFIQLESWRKEAHFKLDQIADEKRQEIQSKISEYRLMLVKKMEENKLKIQILREKLHELSQQTNLTNRDLKFIEEKIEQIKYFLKLIEKDFIKVSADNFSIHISTHFFENRSLSIVQKITSSMNTSRPQTCRTSRSNIKEINNDATKLRRDKKRSLSACPIK